MRVRIVYHHWNDNTIIMNGKNLYWFSPNFIYSSIFHLTIQFTFFPTKISLTQPIIENSPKKHFLKRIFFYGKLPINISTRGIIRSRAQSSVSSILDQRTRSKGSRKKSSQPSSPDIIPWTNDSRTLQKN